MEKYSIEDREYVILNSHLLNKCHPETCGCPGDYIVCKKRRVEAMPYGFETKYDRIHYVFSEEYGEEVIELLTKYPKIFETTPNFEQGLMKLVKTLEKKLILKKKKKNHT